MATTWGILPITLGNMPGQYKEPNILSIPMASSPEFKPGDAIALSSGLMNEASTNPAAIVGFAAISSSAVYGITAAQPATTYAYDGYQFGWSAADNTSSALYPPAVLNGLVYDASNGQIFEGSYDTALTQAKLGTTAGLALDSTTDFWYLAHAGGNAICTIVGIVYRPAGSVIGDTYARVLFTVAAADVTI